MRVILILLLFTGIARADYIDTLEAKLRPWTKLDTYSWNKFDAHRFRINFMIEHMKERRCSQVEIDLAVSEYALINYLQVRRCECCGRAIEASPKIPYGVITYGQRCEACQDEVKILNARRKELTRYKAYGMYWHYSNRYGRRVHACKYCGDVIYTEDGWGVMRDEVCEKEGCRREAIRDIRRPQCFKFDYEKIRHIRLDYWHG